VGGGTPCYGRVSKVWSRGGGHGIRIVVVGTLLLGSWRLRVLDHTRG